ncbi:MAG: hypothetical protein BJ554DRAFT_7768 [Olpidium bornovanus]|uniref:Uncharacterized protein n=1 Tax=Olpidium bornovanus TaxID=278681 RepID=A0A8H7ZVQ0_9FUNG|nr:MAG: hypothetical protein BJ554DRAFT_7768 [Olpidium bornovanus]
MPRVQVRAGPGSAGAAAWLVKFFAHLNHHQPAFLSGSSRNCVSPVDARPCVPSFPVKGSALPPKISRNARETRSRSHDRIRLQLVFDRSARLLNIPVFFPVGSPLPAKEFAPSKEHAQLVDYQSDTDGGDSEH